MCGIAGILNINSSKVPALEKALFVMNHIQKHRGPDGEGLWTSPDQKIGFAHRRLSIIDLQTGQQPMTDSYKNTICYNGEIYNYIELRNQLKDTYPFHTSSDTEVILAAYKKWGSDCVTHLRGMFAFALWDETNKMLFCARDRFGIKPFYYTSSGDNFYFASEIKAILPFLKDIDVDTDALKDYLYFQLYLYGKTLFKNVSELLPSHRMIVKNGSIKTDRYWEVYYHLDWDHTSTYFENRLSELIEDSVKMHIRSDVPVASYISGGADSGIIASLASRFHNSTDPFMGFIGKFTLGDLYDESSYAKDLANMQNIDLHEIAITSQDFIDVISKVIYHLDVPVAGPGSFPQYMVSKLASQHRKVLLGGQGGDEIFGGYVRYLIAYFEQCIKGAVDNTLHSGNYVVTYESIIPNLVALQNYKPLMQEFFRDGMFEDTDKRYFRLINRSPDIKNEIDLNQLGSYSPFDTFCKIFNGNNVGKESYFDKMTHFDFKTLLPALLQVEDRMSMAHGLESRVPFLDHPLVEFVATIPSNVKFNNGTLKKILINTMKHELPESIVNRKNKMGFPVPLNEWVKGELKDFIGDVFVTQRNKKRPYFNSDAILKGFESESNFGRKTWGLLSLELWYQEFIDKRSSYQALLKQSKFPPVSV